MRNARPLSLLIATIAALLAGACDRPASEPSTARQAQADTPPTKLADRAGDAMGLATAADDSAITAKVKAAIIAEPGLKSLDINVDTKDATVTLFGTVDSANLRDRAKQIASSTPGVRSVVDYLLVIKTTS
jgi:hyperosmotically inducible protein